MNQLYKTRVHGERGNRAAALASEPRGDHDPPPFAVPVNTDHPDSELDHAQDILSDLIRTVATALRFATAEEIDWPLSGPRPLAIVG